MAGVAEREVTQGINWGGLTTIGNGLSLYVGCGRFTTTGATVVINHPFGTGPIFKADASPHNATWNTHDQLEFSYGTGANVLNYDTEMGALKAVTSGKATITRDSSGESGERFSVVMIGRPNQS